MRRSPPSNMRKRLLAWRLGGTRGRAGVAARLGRSSLNVNVRTIFVDDDGAEWRVTDWRQIMNGVYQKVPAGDPAASGRLFVRIASGERRFYGFNTARPDAESRLLLPKLLGEQLAKARPRNDTLERAGQWDIETGEPFPNP